MADREGNRISVVTALVVADLKEMIHQVAFAASSDDARPVLTGVLVTVEDKMVIMAAADGFRLSVREAELSKNAPKSIHAISLFAELAHNTRPRMIVLSLFLLPCFQLCVQTVRAEDGFSLTAQGIKLVT